MAISNRNGIREVMAVGMTAKKMVGRTPEAIETIRPLRDGVIADFEVTEYMLREFVQGRLNAFVFDIERAGKPEKLIYLIR